MAQTLKKKTFEVPLTFGDNIRFIKGVTKYTTCSDVIKMVLRKLDAGKENGGTDAFGIYESSRGIERLLPSKSKILKIMRSWGMGDQYEFVFRKVNPGFSMPYLSEAKRRKLTHRRPAVQERRVNKPSTGGQNCTRVLYSHPNESVKELYFNHDSDSSIEERVPSLKRTGPVNARMCQKNKLASAGICDISRNVTGQSDNTLVFNKCVSSNIKVNNVKYAVKKTLKPKPCGISGSDSHIEKVGTLVDPKMPQGGHIKSHEKLARDIVTKLNGVNQTAAKEALLQKYFADYITYRSPGYAFRDSRFRERGDGAEAADVVKVGRQTVGSEYNHMTPVRHTEPRPTSLFFGDSGSDSGHEGDVTNFDTAFIDDKYHSSAIKNTDYAGKLVDYSFSEDGSILSDPSDISTCSENTHNVSSVSDIVKHAFLDYPASSEDDEMESFMKTKLEEDFSDEGLSSLGSEDGKENLI